LKYAILVPLLTTLLLLGMSTAAYAQVDRLFVVDGVSSRIYELDPTTGAAINSFAAPEPASGGPDGLGFGAGRMFYVNGYGTNTIYELNPNTGAVGNSFAAPAGPIDALAFSGT